MKQKFKVLERDQIKPRLDLLFAHQELLSTPKKGWIQAVRKVLGLTTTQLARMMGVSQPRITMLEKAEIEGTTTLRTLGEVAKAMNCRLEYSFIPQKPIDEFLTKRAYEVAISKVLSGTDSLGNNMQGLSVKEKKKKMKHIVEKLLQNPKKLWD